MSGNPSVFSGAIAPASLKHSPARRGLALRFVFSGAIAPASLKPEDASLLFFHTSRFFRGNCPGLIEAPGRKAARDRPPTFFPGQLPRPH